MKRFTLPDLGEGLTEAEIHEWHVAEGEHVEVDQALVSVETAKALVEVPSPYCGKITKRHGEAGEVIKTGAPLVEFDIAEAQTKDATQSNDNSTTVAGSIESSDEILHEAAMGITPSQTDTTAIKALPATRALAKLLDIDLHLVKPTGLQGEVTANDIKYLYQKLVHSANNHGSNTQTETDSAIGTGVGSQSTTNISSDQQQENWHTVTGLRRQMAVTMASAHREVVHATIVDEATVNHWDETTDVTTKLLQALCTACREEPALNAHFDGKLMTRRLFDSVHVGLAIDTPQGLLVPVIHEADNMTASELRTHINQLKQQAAERSLSPSQFENATITLSNFGLFAGRYATPVIVPPAVAILGCGRTYPSVAVVDQQVLPQQRLPLSLSFDHRAVTGGEASRFLAKVLAELEK